MPGDFQHNYAQVNGIKMHYVTAGQEGSPIMFVHGFPEFWYEWKDQLAELGQNYRTVAPDLRGYNLSEKPAELEQYNVSILVNDLRGLADHLGWNKFTMVAHDWGGILGWAFAQTYPERLERLVIVNAPHPGIFLRELRENPVQQQASQYMIRFRHPKAELALAANNYDAMINQIMGEGFKQGYFNEADRQAYLEAWSQPGALTGGLNFYRAARVGPPTPESPEVSADVWPKDQTVRVPTLVIWGERDLALTTNNLTGLDEFVPDLQIKRVPDGSHWVIHEQPTLINGYIREFIEGK